MNIEGIDRLDNQILEVIKDDARLSYSEIGISISPPFPHLGHSKGYLLFMFFTPSASWC